MKTDVVCADSAVGRQRAVKVLESGGLVAFPTDTVYGLAASPWDDDAVECLYRVKERARDLPIPLLLSDAGLIFRVAALPEQCQPLPKHFWPGGLTLVLPKTAAVSAAVSPRETVAVRMPDLRLTRELIREAGGILAVTSANVSGEPSPVTASDVEAQLGGRIPLIVDGGPCRVGVASTVLDCSVSPPLVLRRGAVGVEELQAVVGAVRLA